MTWYQCADKDCHHGLYILKDISDDHRGLEEWIQLDENTLALYVLRYNITSDELKFGAVERGI
jgi:hypothetical protein